jgi:RNA methyltransferase, TrmH family
MKTIISTNNETIKHLVSLHIKKNRTLHKQFLAEGLRTCSTLINSGIKCIQLYATEHIVPHIQQLVDASLITIISPACLQKICTTKTPSGLVGVFEIPTPHIPLKLSPGIVLSDISDPGNMGTLIRSSIAFGYKDIIIVDGVDPWNPKVIQSSAGTIGYANLIHSTWQELITHTQRPPLGALIPHGGTEIDNKSYLLVVGSEAHGLPHTYIDACETKISLPMPGGTESLNASIAGSLALYLMATQKNC